MHSSRFPASKSRCPTPAQYTWLSHHSLYGVSPVAARVTGVTLGEHSGFVVINRGLNATPEHLFLVRRGDEWGFSSAEFIKKGDYLIGERLAEERVQTVERVDAPTRTVAVHIRGTNTFSAEGVWVHNDMPATAQSSGSGSSSSASGSGSGSGSGSSSSSGSTSGSGKSSGSSMSSSGSGSGSGSGSSSSGGGTGTFSI